MIVFNIIYEIINKELYLQTSLKKPMQKISLIVSFRRHVSKNCIKYLGINVQRTFRKTSIYIHIHIIGANLSLDRVSSGLLLK